MKKSNHSWAKRIPGAIVTVSIENSPEKRDKSFGRIVKNGKRMKTESVISESRVVERKKIDTRANLSIIDLNAHRFLATSLASFCKSKNKEEIRTILRRET